jgi:diguanylate cyclase (GGDEF)-like protein
MKKKSSPTVRAAVTDRRTGREPAAAKKIRLLERKLAAARREIAHLEAVAETDFLLGVPNRRGFERELVRAIAYIKRYQASGALIVLDVDRLKPINDTFGHAAGDVVLKAVVEVLQQHVRASDVLGRLGGDEFALLLWNLSKADAVAKAAALEASVDRLAVAFDGHMISVGISAGVMDIDLQAEAAEVLSRADAAMYARKEARRLQSVGQASGARGQAS